jgi:hypothetical protein
MHLNQEDLGSMVGISANRQPLPHPLPPRRPGRSDQRPHHPHQPLPPRSSLPRTLRPTPTKYSCRSRRTSSGNFSILRPFLPREFRIELQRPVVTILPTVKFTGLKINVLSSCLRVQQGGQLILSLRQRRQHQQRRAARSSFISSTWSVAGTRCRQRFLHNPGERVRWHLVIPPTQSSSRFTFHTVCDLNHVPQPLSTPLPFIASKIHSVRPHPRDIL